MRKARQAIHDESGITFGELYKLYYERHACVRTRYPQNAQDFFKSHGHKWANVPVESITRRDVQSWIDDLGTTSKSAATRAWEMMRAVINWGNKRELIDIRNPCNGVDHFKIKPRTRFLLPEEFPRFEAALSEEPEIFQDFFWLCLYTGARSGNVMSMNWKEIDLDLKIWQIPIEKFKNGDSHVVPLSETACAILKRRRMSSDLSSFVFPSSGKTGHLVEPKSAWKRITERANLKDLRIHDLRRTNGSYMAIEGYSSYVIGKMLGHLDQRSTQIYARLDLKTVREAAEKIARLWSSYKADNSSRRLKLKNNRKAVPLEIDLSKKNATRKTSATEQILIEAKILTTLRRGQTTKKHFYQAVGDCLPLNCRELDRILKEMEARNLISKYRDQKNWRYWRYGLVTNEA